MWSIWARTATSSLLDPNTLVANVGDSVTFQLNNTSLSVSYSGSLTEPCAWPVGLSTVPGKKKYTVYIDDMKPILMRCTEYCHLGMVMIINPEKATDINTMSRAASQDLSSPLTDTGGPLHATLPQPGQPGHSTTKTSGESHAPSSTAPASSVSSVGTTGSPRPTPNSPAPGRENSGGHTRTRAAAAVAAALVLSAILVAGTWYMWRRRVKRRPWSDTVRWVDFSAAPTEDAFTRKGELIMAAPAGESDAAEDDSRITPFTPPGRTGLQRWKTKVFGAGGRASLGDGDSNAAAGAAEAAIAHLQAELGRVLAENELLRQNSEPPAYSDGARSVIEAA